jgi:hypothetical protein
VQGFIYTLEQANKKMAPFGEPADGQLTGGKEEQEQELALIHRRAIAILLYLYCTGAVGNVTVGGRRRRRKRRRRM